MNLELNSIGLDKKPSDTKVIVATITFVSDGFLSNPIEFNSKFMWWYLYSFLL